MTGMDQHTYCRTHVLFYMCIYMDETCTRWCSSDSDAGSTGHSHGP